MENTNSILKCFVSVTAGNYTDTVEQRNEATEQGRFFRTFIWGEEGISKKLEKLNYEDYGKDLILILLQFYVNPNLSEIENFSPIEKYRKREKAIGIPIVVNKQNFFDKTESEKCEFLQQSIVIKMDVLNETVKKLKLDTNMDLLKSDLKKVLDESIII
jgi:hypothetical protein